MIFDSIKNRVWQLKLSLFSRKCYFTGQNLQFKLCYCGRKQIKDTANLMSVDVKELLKMVGMKGTQEDMIFLIESIMENML